ncbi:MAG: flagellar hook-length control protein FliK, partial [Rhodospirillales bacterium]
QSQNVTQAAAVYAAGLIGKTGTENQKAQTGDAAQQVQKAVNVTESVPAQLAAAAATKGKQATHNTQGRDAAALSTAARGGEQKAENPALKGDNRGVQAQAQQMSRIIGAENRVNINVNVANEQNQLTSKPALLATSNLVLAQDATKGSQTGTNAQSGQQQGQNTQQLQQALLATQQQTQVPQQGTPQIGPQGGAGVATLGGNGASSAVQAGNGGMQTTGGGEALNNTSQGANAAQQTHQTQQTRESAPHQQAQHLQRDSQPGGSVTEQISVKITKALQAGTDKISIQLKPAELGRVDVKLEMTHDGRVMTVVTAEKQDTLDLLRRDSSELQKALADAGLQSGDMQFNLKGQDKQTAEGDNADMQGAADKAADADIDTADDGVVMTAWESGIFANGRLDMRA